MLSDAFSEVVIIDRRAAATDPAIHVAFLRVMHMMRSPFSRMAPGALAHVLARTAGRVLGPPPPRAVKASLVEPQALCTAAAARVAAVRIDR